MVQIVFYPFPCTPLKLRKYNSLLNTHAFCRLNSNDSLYIFYMVILIFSRSLFIDKTFKTIDFSNAW